MGLSAALRVALSLMTYINPKSDELRPLREYSGRLPSSRPGKRLNPSTLFRWASQGVRGQVLETRLLGGCVGARIHGPAERTRSFKCLGNQPDRYQGSQVDPRVRRSSARSRGGSWIARSLWDWPRSTGGAFEDHSSESRSIDSNSTITTIRSRRIEIDLRRMG